MSKKIPVELATVFYAQRNQITEIAFRVYGGKSHVERVEAARDYLSDWTEYFQSSEGTVISVDSYQCKAEFTPSGKPFVLFTFGNFTNSF